MIITIGSSVPDNQGNEYILDDIAGQGGFGIVYKAHRKSDGAIFAVKTLFPAISNTDAVRSFENEIRLSQTIKNDNIVNYEFAHDGTMFPNLPPYIIMEFASDGTLADQIEAMKKSGSKLDTGTIIDIFRQLISGMSALNKTIVHRDIKPQNILRFGSQYKISDFGLSKYATESTRSLTFKGYGSALYFAPEAWQNEHNTILMDIYSMGIVFYEISTLEYPYEIKDMNDIASIRMAHLTAPVKKGIIQQNLPSNIVSLVLRMLEKKAQNRYSNWEDVLKGINASIDSDVPVHLAIERAVRATIEADIEKQKKQAAIETQKQNEIEYRHLIVSQFSSSIFEPISDFVEGYNALYQGTNQLRLTKSTPNDANTERMHHVLTTPFGTKITIDVACVMPYSLRRRVPADRVFGGNGYREEGYTPRCENRDILAWGSIESDDQTGFNVLLLKDDAEGAIYGDWIILENTNNGLSRSDRRSPFGFHINELPGEIELIHALHIYSTKVLPLSTQYMFDFIQSCIEKDKYKV